ncbi:MAG: 2-amino-4-hydroxy-6-hydroxymethyldihydropteridine diphosphokinase, partial [Paracoccaceae bacterium]|nr:2-amino-4-hydroxy-6-hydroxymethyldihydropteridine diphosphokinase [Paracoccaceae bacterium]
AYGETIEPDIDELKRLMALGLTAIDEPPPDLLVLPHPRMHERGFVLAPMAEIAPDWRHPALGKTTAEMLADLPPEHLEGMSRI